MKIKQFLKLLEENIGINLSNVSMMSEKTLTKCVYMKNVLMLVSVALGIMVTFFNL